MTYSGNVTGQIEGIRQQTVAVLDELSARADEFELADPPQALGQYRQKLRENVVNALIWRDALPIDVDVATSQVFNIRPLEREAYRLRFEDGSEREILQKDLPRYGLVEEWTPGP